MPLRSFRRPQESFNPFDAFVIQPRRLLRQFGRYCHTINWRHGMEERSDAGVENGAGLEGENFRLLIERVNLSPLRYFSIRRNDTKL